MIDMCQIVLVSSVIHFVSSYEIRNQFDDNLFIPQQKIYSANLKCGRLPTKQVQMYEQQEQSFSTSVTQKFGHYSSSTSIKPVQTFSFVFTLIDRLCEILQKQIEKPLDFHIEDGELKSIRCSIDDISNSLQLISSFVIQECQKIDLFEECLKKIFILFQLHSQFKSGIKSKTSQESNNRNTYLGLIRKITEIILNKLILKKMNSKAIIKYAKIIFSIFYQQSPIRSSIIIQNKNKTKQPAKKGKKDEKKFGYSLLSGSIISFQWYLLFKIIQAQMTYQLLTEQNLSSLQMENVVSIINQNCENNIKKYIRQLVDGLILNQANDSHLFFSLLSCVIKNFGEIQLPIIPFFFDSINSSLIQKFKIMNKAYSESKSSYQYLSKQIFSPDNLCVILTLYTDLANNIINIEWSKQKLLNDTNCSLCGTRQVIGQQVSKLTLLPSGLQYLILNICQNCQRRMKYDDLKISNLMLLCPIILSRFWQNEYGSFDCLSLKKAIKCIFLYQQDQHIHQLNKKQKYFYFPERIAMNNMDERIHSKLIDKIYKYFLFHHSKFNLLSRLSDMIDVIVILLSWNSTQVRQKVMNVVYDTELYGSLIEFQKRIPNHNLSIISKKKYNLLKTIQRRLSDVEEKVKLSALKLMCSLYQKNMLNKVEAKEFVNCLYNQLAFSVDFNYIYSCFLAIETNIIDPCIKILSYSLKTKNNISQDIENSFEILFKSINLVIECIDRQNNYFNVCNSNLTENILQKAYKIFKDLICCVYELASKQQNQSTNVLIHQFNLFLSKAKPNRQDSHNALGLFHQMMILVFSSIKLDENVLQIIPTVSLKVISTLLQEINVTNSVSSKKIEHNCINIIKIMFKETQSILNIISNGNPSKDSKDFKKSKSKSKSKKKHEKWVELKYYLNSSEFFMQVLHQNSRNLSENSCGNNILNELECFQQLKRQNYAILCELIQKNNMNEKIKQLSRLPKFQQLFNFHMSFLEEGGLVLNPIASAKLQSFIKHLEMKMKTDCFQEIQIKGQAYVHCLIFVYKQSLIQQVINIYDKRAKDFYSHFLLSCESLKTNSNNNQIISELNRNYASTLRCLMIIGVLTSTYQRYLSIQYKLEDIKRQLQITKELQNCNKFNDNVESLSTSNQRTQIKNDDIFQFENVNASNLFKRNYHLISQIVMAQLDSDISFKNSKQMDQKLISVLRFYWNLYPMIILSSRQLVNKLIRKSLSLNMIKQLYKLFCALLPTNNTNILSLIDSAFNSTFEVVIENKNLRGDLYLLQKAYQILYYVLLSGMSGLYNFNKYLLFALLHSSNKINLIALKIINQLYKFEGSSLTIFTNLNETLKFTFKISFNFSKDCTIKDLLTGIKLGDNQIQKIRQMNNILSNKQKGAILIKQKIKIKIKPTLIKKIGQIISSEHNLIQIDPKYFYFLLQIIKSCNQLDCSELIEIIYSLQMVMNQNELEISKILESSFQQQSNSQFILQKLIVYRQLVGCLCILTGYNELSQQIKQYNHLFETSQSIYVNLSEQIPNQDIIYSSNQQIFNILCEEIQIFSGIINGDIQNQKMFEDKVTKANDYEDQYKTRSRMTSKHQKRKKKQLITTKKAIQSKSVDVKRNKSNINCQQISINQYKNKLRQKKTRILIPQNN